MLKFRVKHAAGGAALRVEVPGDATYVHLAQAISAAAGVADVSELRVSLNRKVRHTSKAARKHDFPYFEITSDRFRLFFVTLLFLRSRRSTWM
jgi:hypothetical protein